MFNQLSKNHDHRHTTKPTSIVPYEKARSINKTKTSEALARSKSLNKIENKMKNIERMLKLADSELKNVKSSNQDSAQKVQLKLSANYSINDISSNSLSMKSNNLKKIVELHNRFGNKTKQSPFHQQTDENLLKILNSNQKKARQKHNFSIDLGEPNT